MSYDTKIIVIDVQGKKEHFVGDVVRDVTVGSEIARFNLSNIDKSNFAHLWKKTQKESQEYFGFWGDNGNSIITEDLYGDPLFGMPIKDCINALSRDCSEDTYRRFPIALNLLNSIADRFDTLNLSVVWFAC